VEVGGRTNQEPEERGIVEDNLISAETHNKKGREEKIREDISEERGAEARHLMRRVGRRQVGRIS
jgi:hypothetical protein